MIIIKLKGGLGNQLFQYTAGRALSLRQQNSNGTPVQLKLDITGYGENNGIDTMRHYSLLTFNIKTEFATTTEIHDLKYSYGVISKGIRFIKFKVLRQFNTGFNKGIFNSKGNLYLDGFFQTEKYIKDAEQQIREDLKIIVPLSTRAREMSELIKNTKNGVSLHIRRGDYVNDQKTNQYHGTCSPEYYQKALEYMTSKVGKDIHLFIFSDDIEWVKNNMTFSYPTTYVSSPEIADYEELYLMSLCKHHIIANSSYSWWGAWLNPKSDKIVIAPKRWTLKDDKNYKDICPPSWIRI